MSDFGSVLALDVAAFSAAIVGTEKAAHASSVIHRKNLLVPIYSSIDNSGIDPIVWPLLLMSFLPRELRVCQVLYSF
jgi:hypothetical protein